MPALFTMSGQPNGHYTRELHDQQFQITNLPMLIPDHDGDPPLTPDLILNTPPLQIIDISTHNPYDFVAGDEDELDERLDNVFTAFRCGDRRLLLEPEDCESWLWLSRFPAILGGVDSDWSLIGAGLDIHGLSFFIANLPAAADGEVVIKDIVPSVSGHKFEVVIRLEDGHLYGCHIGREGKKIEGPVLVTVANPDGSFDVMNLRTSALNPFQTCAEIDHLLPSTPIHLTPNRTRL